MVPFVLLFRGFPPHFFSLLVVSSISPKCVHDPGLLEVIATSTFFPRSQPTPAFLFYDINSFFLAHHGKYCLFFSPPTVVCRPSIISGGTGFLLFRVFFPVAVAGVICALTQRSHSLLRWCCLRAFLPVPERWIAQCDLPARSREDSPWSFVFSRWCSERDDRAIVGGGVFCVHRAVCFLFCSYRAATLRSPFWFFSCGHPRPYPSISHVQAHRFFSLPVSFLSVLAHVEHAYRHSSVFLGGHLRCVLDCSLFIFTV